MTKELVALDRLAKQINDAHSEVKASFGHSLQHAIRAGELLTEAKAQLNHGEWLPWLEKSVQFSERSARSYIEVFENRDLLYRNRQYIADLGLVGALRLLRKGTPMLQSMSNEWYTPPKYIDAVHKVMGGIDLDPATSPEANKIVKAKRFYTEEHNGLEQDWEGRVFLNPPYGGNSGAFIKKLMESLDAEVTEAILLVNANATDTDWFQPCFDGVMCFTDHRIDFLSPSKKATSSTHGSCFVYFGPNKDKFHREFSKFGNIVVRYRD